MPPRFLLAAAGAARQRPPHRLSTGDVFFPAAQRRALQARATRSSSSSRWCEELAHGKCIDLSLPPQTCRLLACTAQDVKIHAATTVCVPSLFRPVPVAESLRLILVALLALICQDSISPFLHGEGTPVTYLLHRCLHCSIDRCSGVSESV